MPEDWRTLVDAHLYSINTSMVPEVIDLLMLFIALSGIVEFGWPAASSRSCFMQYLPHCLANYCHLLNALLIKRHKSKLHGAVLCCAVLCCAVLCCAVLCCAVL